jgi:hypothetical protein
MKPISLKTRDSLRNLNIAAGILHACFAVLIVVTVIVIDSPFYLVFEKLIKVPDVDNFHPVLFNNTCNNTIYTDVFLWFRECIENKVVVPSKIDVIFLSKIKVWVLIFVFEAITSLSHFYIAYFSPYYYSDLNMLLSPSRWREYSISNTIMIVAILALSNVSDVYLLLSIALAAASMNFFGGFIYELLDSIQQMKNLDERRMYLIKEAKYVILLLTWTTFLLSLVYLFDVFFTYLSVLYTLPNKGLWESFFNIILVLNIGIVVAYSVFPILHALRHFSSVNHILIEKGYIIASLVAKSFLSLIVFVASIQRNT